MPAAKGELSPKLREYEREVESLSAALKLKSSVVFGTDGFEGDVKKIIEGALFVAMVIVNGLVSVPLALVADIDALNVPFKFGTPAITPAAVGNARLAGNPAAP